MPARFVITSLVTKRVGIDAHFVTLVTKRAVVTKRAATDDGAHRIQDYLCMLMIRLGTSLAGALIWDLCLS